MSMFTYNNQEAKACPRCGVVILRNADFVSCIGCGFRSFDDERVQVDWKRHNWTAESQLEKILEEVGEVAAALIRGDIIEATRETLDVKQTCGTMLAILAYNWETKYGTPYPLEKIQQEHIEKLEKKGYL